VPETNSVPLSVASGAAAFAALQVLDLRLFFLSILLRFELRELFLDRLQLASQLFNLLL
jgi:hypothetical protein